MSTSLASSSGRGGGRVALDRGLVDADPHHRRSLTIGSSSSPEHLARARRPPVAGDSRFAPVELRLHDARLPVGLPPAGVAGSAGPALVYAHFCGTPGNAQVDVQVGGGRSRPAGSTAPTVTAGRSGPMPATSGWNNASTSAPVAPTNSTAVRSFLASPAASSAAARSGCHSGRDRGRRVRRYSRPPASTTVRQGHERRRRTGPSCHPTPGPRRVPVMAIYASRPGRLAGQLHRRCLRPGLGLWPGRWSGVFVHQVVEVLAVPARETARTASRLVADLHDAADQASRVPGVGDDLRQPVRCGIGHAGQCDHLRQPAGGEHRAARGDRRLAGVPDPGGRRGGVLAAATDPVLPPGHASQQFLDSSADLDLFALRAMASQPLYVWPVSATTRSGPGGPETAGDQPARRDRAASQRTPPSEDRLG